MSLGVFKKVDGGALRPVDDASAAILSGVKLGADVMVEVKRARNPLHHRKMFALLGIVLDNQDHYDSIDTLLVAIKIATGHCDTIILSNGDVAYTPKSIAFHAMGQGEFEAFYDKVINIVVDRWLPGVETAELRRQVEEFI